MSESRLKKRIQKNKKRAQLKKKRVRLLGGLAFLCLLCLCGVVYGMLYRYVSRFPKDQILTNVYIGPVEVSGMTAEEAVWSIETYRKERLADRVTMEVEGQSAEATLGELGLDKHPGTGDRPGCKAGGKQGGPLWKRRNCDPEIPEDTRPF